MHLLDRISGGLLYASQQAALLSREPFPTADRASARFMAAESAANSVAACAAAGCSGGWLKNWKNRSRPYFEGEWACSRRCLQTRVRAVVRREVGDTTIDEGLPHRHRVPLGLVLLAQGWINHGQLQSALEAQRRSGRGRIGDWLIEECGVSAERVTRGLGVQWNRPVLTLDGFSPSAMALVMPPLVAAQSGLVPVRTAGRSFLYLGFESHLNSAAALAIERMSGLHVETGLLSEADFAHACRSVKASDAVPVRHTCVPEQDALCEGIAGVIEQRQPVASRMVRVGQLYWLRVWLESGARSGVGDLPPDLQDAEDHLFSIGSTVPPIH